jgi:tetratricopeptide (TPR) repeat protein
VGADRLGAVRARWERGRHLMAVGKPQAAQRALTAALAELGSGDERATAELRARVAITLANAEFELDGPAAAAARLDAAAAEIAAHGLREVRISLQNQRGLIALRAGRLAEAVRSFDAALPFEPDAPANERCYVLLNRAVAQLELGALAAARADLRACAAGARDAGLDLVEAKAMHNLGYAEFLAGNLPEALQLMDAAAAMAPDDSPGIALLAKAQVLTEAGRHRAADTVLAEAAGIFRRDRLQQDLGEAELDRARCSLALGDVAAARRSARRAQALFTRRGSDAWRRSAELVQLSGRLAGGGGGAALVTAAEALAGELAAGGLTLQARTAALIAVEAEVTRGRAERASDRLAGIAPPRRTDPVTGRLHWHYVTARVDAARGERAAAGRRIRRALGELAAYQASFGSIDLRTAAAVHGRHLAELDLALALESGRAGAVFAAAERARAVTSRLPPVRPPADPVAADQLAELRQVIESLRAVEYDRAASAALLARRRDLERRIVARSWTVSGPGAGVAAASLAVVRARLAAGEWSMTTFVQAGGALVAVTVGRHVRLHELGPAAPVVEGVRRLRADLDVLAQPRLPAGIRGAVQASLERSLAELDAALVRPLRPDGPQVLVSTGALGQLPWALLPSLRGVPVVVAPSATRWLRSASNGGAAAGKPAVAVLAGPDLPGAPLEAAAVAGAWPGATLAVGPDATCAAFTRAVPSAAVLHVAAHGVHHVENPLFSSVRMADGVVFAHELDRTARAPEHVVLSACELGLATVRPGDEALGLASVLLQLGTASVVAGLARVPDDLAAAAMIDYHRRLAAGADAASALAAVVADADRPLPFACFGSSWTAGTSAG